MDAIQKKLIFWKLFENEVLSILIDIEIIFTIVFQCLGFVLFLNFDGKNASKQLEAIFIEFQHFNVL